MSWQNMIPFLVWGILYYPLKEIGLYFYIKNTNNYPSEMIRLIYSLISIAIPITLLCLGLIKW